MIKAFLVEREGLAQSHDSHALGLSHPLLGEAINKSKPVRCAHYVLLFLKNLLKQVWQNPSKTTKPRYCEALICLAESEGFEPPNL